MSAGTSPTARSPFRPVMCLWVLFFSASTTVLFWPTVRSIDQQRPAPAAAGERYAEIIHANDTEEFIRHLNIAVDALGQGRLYFPVSDFDCPVSFLFPCAAVCRSTGYSPLAVMNGFTLAAVVLNGLFAFAFLRAIGVATAFAAPLAVAFQGSNFVAYSQHMGHMNYVQVGWLAAAFWTTARLCREQHWRWAVGLGVAMGAQALSSPSFTVYLTFAALPTFCLGYWITALRQGAATRADALRFAGRGVTAAAVALGIAGFYLVERMGNPPRTFPPPTWLPYALHHYLELLDPAHPSVFLGLPLSVLGILAVNWWWANRPPLAVACGATAVVSLVLMFPAIPGTPYWALYKIVPWFKYLRVPTRFFPIFLLALTGLIGLYLTAGTAAQSTARKWLLAFGLLAALAVGNWLTSDWYYPVEPVSVVKRLLGK